MIGSVSQLKNEMVDRAAIQDCLCRYARAVDRLDEDLLRTVYWPEAIDNHLVFSGNVEEFIAWAFPKMRAMNQNFHMLGNTLSRLDGATAKVETYFYGIQCAEIAGRVRDTVAAGRYLDRFERRTIRVAFRTLRSPSLGVCDGLFYRSSSRRAVAR